MIALLPAELAELKAILAEHVPELSVWAFGSRVHGRHLKPHSDLDLALRGEPALAPPRMATLQQAFADSDLPFRVDLVGWATISPEFRALIRAAYIELQPGAKTSAVR